LLRQIRYIRFVALTAILITSTGDAFLGQGGCPRISVECASHDECCSGPFEFSARITGGYRADTVLYNWSISSGRIISGQGTPSIKVDSTGFGGQTVTATVEVKGLEANCSRMASATQMICDAPPPARLFVRYSKASFAKQNSILGRFAAQLRNEPGAQGYVLVRGHHLHPERAKEYLTVKGGIAADRIVIIAAGSGKKTIELYVVPTGAIPPTIDGAAPPNKGMQRTRN